jgi:hypothetical protein
VAEWRRLNNESKLSHPVVAQSVPRGFVLRAAYANFENHPNQKSKRG